MPTSRVARPAARPAATFRVGWVRGEMVVYVVVRDYATVRTQGGDGIFGLLYGEAYLDERPN